MVRISEDALDELSDGYLLYEAQQAGLGDYFASCLRGDIEADVEFAPVHGVVACWYPLDESERILRPERGRSCGQAQMGNPRNQ